MCFSVGQHVGNIFAFLISHSLAGRSSENLKRLATEGARETIRKGRNDAAPCHP